MGLYTKNYLRNLSLNHYSTNEFVTLAESAKSKTRFDIFLSHSYKDKEYIKGLFYELSKMGFSVYVDWIIDPYFNRSEVTKDTVTKIRKRMEQSKSLVYATSENASSSKWMPWELGFMDGDNRNCAILPIADYESDSFKGQEFFISISSNKKRKLE